MFHQFYVDVFDLCPVIYTQIWSRLSNYLYYFNVRVFQFCVVFFTSLDHVSLTCIYSSQVRVFEFCPIFFTRLISRSLPCLYWFHVRHLSNKHTLYHEPRFWSTSVFVLYLSNRSCCRCPSLRSSLRFFVHPWKISLVLLLYNEMECFV